MRAYPQMPSFGGSGSSGGSEPEPLADGYYSLIQTSGTPLAPDDPGWTFLGTVGTILNDVGVNDHTTSVETTSPTSPTLYAFGMYHVAASNLWGSYTASLARTETAVVVILYWDGNSWETWDTEALLDQLGGSLVWSDISKTPIAQDSIAVCIGIRDSGFVGPFDARIGDFRPA